MKGMILGLKEMHDYRIMHRDIKPENIMLRGESGLVPVIADFGLSADVDCEDYIFYRCGTPGYVAPEVTTLAKGEHIEPECDIFSLGAIFHILLVRRPLFEGKKCEEVYENNKKLKFNLSSSIYKNVDS
jgi:calcium-dependent protein kinase